MPTQNLLQVVTMIKTEKFYCIELYEILHERLPFYIGRVCMVQYNSMMGLANKLGSYSHILTKIIIT